MFLYPDFALELGQSREDFGLAFEESLAFALGSGQAGDFGAEVLAVGFQGAAVGLAPLHPARNGHRGFLQTARPPPYRL